MISYLKKLYEDWQAAGAEGPDPELLAREKMQDGQLRRVNKEQFKALRWGGLNMDRMSIFQLARLHRAARRFDAPEVAGNIEVIVEARAKRGALLKSRLATEAALRRSRSLANHSTPAK